ncbi:hypothetical protein VFPPC_11392 [Pochonia chlamydosporia 170]|uniref:Uncharacterized protein n=1 Tax=Pochonia chlamydosporia 170 TaxID=1380566 RepID=A0A179EY33_METCM|nr:hypothetical protein VFPPC_11392 [Pochonia chlamydosporia 170]OAQ58078.2 hypothetical protein VFPPC_11392 [Pochonia chlamydosporia 170]
MLREVCASGPPRDGGIGRHYRRKHKLKGQAIKRVLAYEEELSLTLYDPHEVKLPVNGSIAINQLPMLKGFQGPYQPCDFLTVHPNSLTTHYACPSKGHREAINTSGAARARPGDKVSLQSFSKGGRARYCIVSDIAADDNASGDDSGYGSGFDDMLSSYGQKLTSDEDKRRRTGEAPGGADVDNPWVSWTGWAEHFQEKDLAQICRMSKGPMSDAKLKRVWAATEKQRQRQLRIIADSFERVMARCTSRLRLVPRETLRWLNSIEPTTPHGKPVQLKDHESSMDDYKRYAARYLCYCFGAWQMGQEAANTELGVRFTDLQWDRLRVVVEGVFAIDLRCGGAAVRRGPASSTRQGRPTGGGIVAASRSRSEEDAGDRQEEAELEDMLDRSVMEFWIASIKQKIAFNIFQNPLLHFTAVLGIDPKKLSYKRAADYTGQLAGLVWCVRLLMLEHVFEDQSDNPEELDFAVLERFQEEHHEWLADGTYTPFTSPLTWSQPLSKTPPQDGVAVSDVLEIEAWPETAAELTPTAPTATHDHRLIAESLDITTTQEKQTNLDSTTTKEDPAVLRREQTRLRVQRYRARQHESYFQQKEQPDPLFDTAGNGDAGNINTEDETRVIPDLSQLTLEDHAQHSSSPSACTPKSDNPNGGNTPQPTLDGHSLPLDNGHSSDPVLGSYMQEVLPPSASLSSDFIDSQSATYDEVFKEFFRHECNCSAVPDLNEPEEVHTLRQRVRLLQSLMPTLNMIFGETSSYEPSSSFHQWSGVLGDCPNEPLSFHKTQLELLHTPLEISRRWDVDSIWIGAKTLGAVKSPNDFLLSFLPSAALNHSTNQVVQPHGLSIAKTRHIHLGTVDVFNVRFAVFVLFPKADQGPNSQTSASKNALSLERQKVFYDDIIIPAVYETVPDPFRREIPQSYDMLYAKSRSYQEKLGNTHWKPDDQSRALRLRYSIPAEYLAKFWSSVIEKANLLRIPTASGAEVAYFENPQLLLQSHGLKNRVSGLTLQDTLTCFTENVLKAFNPDQLDMRSCWVDIGCRDHVATQGVHDFPAGPFTLLWKDRCNHQLHERLSAIVPGSPLASTYFRSYLLRDASTYKANAKSTGTSNPGHPDTHCPGIIRAKAYDSIKETFAVMYSDYRIFGSGYLPLLAFTDEMIQDLWSMSRHNEAANTSQINRRSLRRAWEANKRHLKAVCEAKILPSYGARKEVTFCLGPILTMLCRGYFNPELNSHIGKVHKKLSLDTNDGTHCPFWVVPTKDIRALILTQAARFILPLDHLFQQPLINPPRDYNIEDTLEVSVQLVLAYYLAQLLCRLLTYSLSSEQQLPFDNWIWKSKWTVGDKQLNQRAKIVERQGLGLDEVVKSSGMLWIPQACLDWAGGHIALDILAHLYIPRSPLHPRIAAQSNIRLLSATKATSELYLRRWLHQANQAFDLGQQTEAEQLAAKAIRLAAEEVARSYHQHMFTKLAGTWDRLRARVGRCRLSRLKRLQRGQEDTQEQRSKILDAQIIREVYVEAWSEYSKTQYATSHVQMPRQLPCWMVTRAYSRLKNGWSSFIFDRLFDRPDPPSWDRVQFRELYRSFKEMWNMTYSHADSFDNRFRRIIGNYIRVAFNSDKAKEIGTNHGSGTWYEDQPVFFQIQFWAPYFSPPKQHLGTCWDLIVTRPLSYDIPHDAKSNDLTAIEFQDENDAFETLWFETIGQPERLEDMSPDEKSDVFLQAIRHLMTLAGPKWEGEHGLPYVIPWTLPDQAAQNDSHEGDIFRAPLPLSSVKAAHRDAVLSRPTVILPTFHDIMSFTKHISSQSNLCAEAKLLWAFNPGHPDAHKPAIIRAKAYNCNKKPFSVMHRDHRLFGSGFIALLALDEAMIRDLAVNNQNHQRASIPQLNRPAILKAWEANRWHLKALSDAIAHNGQGVRREVTFRLDVILSMWTNGSSDPA